MPSADPDSLSLINATLESTADGLLVVNNEGKIVLFNKKFVAMWKIPEDILSSRDDNKAIGFVLDQLKDPNVFLQKVKDLYNQPDAESFDTLEFKDGRVFERYSKPQKVGDKTVGRVWSFRDVTDRKRVEHELKNKIDELGNLTNLTVNREVKMAELKQKIAELQNNPGTTNTPA